MTALTLIDIETALVAHRRTTATGPGFELSPYLELVRALRELQGGLCAICGVHADDGLVVDHDHDSGLVRGLLCRSCNFTEGKRDHLPGPPTFGTACCELCHYRQHPPVSWLGWTVRYESPRAPLDSLGPTIPFAPAVDLTGRRRARLRAERQAVLDQALARACPVCDAAPGEPCRVRTTGEARPAMHDRRQR